MKKLGIIGGLGPMATAHFMALITKMTEAEKDQDHIEMIIHSRPAIPDRTAFITGQSDLSPEPDLIELGKGLADAGAEILAIPCFSAHYFIDVVRKAAGIPVIDAIEEVASYLKGKSFTKVGILATDGIIHSRLYQDKFEKAGIEVLLPDAYAQKRIMYMIYKIKSGSEVDIINLSLLSQGLFEDGAEAVLLGCSDLSTLEHRADLPPQYLDVLDVLARRAVLECGTLREEYK